MPGVKGRSGGHNRKPTALKILQGNPGRRRLEPEKEPQPELAIPRCPAGLSGAARAEWRRITPHLYDLGLLTEIDLSGLAGYCICFGELLEAERMITRTGRWEVEPKVVRARDEALKQLRGYLVEFGLSPASRSRVRADVQKAADDLPADEAFLSARGLRVVK